MKKLVSVLGFVAVVCLMLAGCKDNLKQPFEETNGHLKTAAVAPEEEEKAEEAGEPCNDPSCEGPAVEQAKPCDNPDCDGPAVEQAKPCNSPDCLGQAVEAKPCNNPECE